MLSIAKVALGQQHYYLELGREDYYLEGGEPPGGWWGRGAKLLDLEGNVTKEALSNLFDGFSPDGSKRLVQLPKGQDRVPSWDCTFSAPKSVSLLWALSSPEVRDTVQRAHDRAVRAALGYLEQEAGFTRRGAEGERVERSVLAFAVFAHGTSRLQDPQLHSHALCLNVSLRDDGTTGTIRSLDLYRHKMAAGSLYRAELASLLQAELGVELRRTEAAFEVDGIDEELIEHYSKRRAEIVEALEASGLSGPKAAEALALETRQVKGHTSRDVLFPRWRNEAALSFGFTEEKLLGLLDRSKKPPQFDHFRTVLAESMRELAEADGVFSERALLAAVAQKAAHLGLSAGDILEQVRVVLGTEEAPLLRPGVEGNLYTTREHAEREREFLAAAERSIGREHPVVSEKTLAGVLSSKPFRTLTAEQTGALRHITARPGSIQVIEGYAGTGKTYLLNAARQVWEKEGYTVLGAAVAGRAARELEAGSGIKSMSVAKLLSRLEPNASPVKHHAKQLLRAAQGKKTFQLPREKLGAKHVLVLDEAGMLSTKDLGRLLAHVERAGAKLVLVGDRHQLPSIEAGGGFAFLADRLGAATLTNITRQRRPWMRQAVLHFRDGDARSALSLYAEAERIHVAKDAKTAARELIERWKTERTRDLKDSLILAGTRAETAELNHLAQETRLAAGELSSRSYFKQGEARFHKGERIAFTKGLAELGVDNGDTGTIERIRKNPLGRAFAVTVRLDRAELGRLGHPNPVRVTFDARKVRDFALGYAQTTHKAQGSTLEKTFVLAGGFMQDHEMSYVQMSRASNDCRIFVSEVAAGEDLAELVRAMERSREKVLAHEHEHAPTLELGLSR